MNNIHCPLNSNIEMDAERIPRLKLTIIYPDNTEYTFTVEPDNDIHTVIADTMEIPPLIRLTEQPPYMFRRSWGNRPLRFELRLT